MARQLTITLPDEVYDRLHDRFGPDQISSFIEKLLQPYVITDNELEAEYREMAADTEREREALAWIGEAPDGALDSDEATCTRSPDESTPRRR